MSDKVNANKKNKRLSVSVLYDDRERVSGLRTITSKQMVGKVYAFPYDLWPEIRQSIPECHCVYVLWEDGNTPRETRVYVGRSQNQKQRLKGHADNPEKSFWQQTAVYVAGDKMGETESRYIEAQLVQMAEKAGLCKLTNKQQKSHTPALNEADKAVADSHIRECLFFLPLAGCVFFNTKHGRVAPAKDAAKKTKHAKTAAYQQGESLFLDTRGIKAEGRETDEGFLVCKGSQAAKDETRGLHNPNLKHLPALRKMLRDEKVLVDGGGTYHFSRDYTFRSPSTAATIVLGRPSNGRWDWKNKDGKSLKDLQDARP